MKTFPTRVAIVLGLLAAGCGVPSKNLSNTRAYGATGSPALATTSAEDESGDEALALDQIPAAVRTAAVNALPGLVIVSAERETEDGVVLYSVTGTLNGVAREIEVSADGQNVHVEGAGDDDDGDDDDQDDD